METDGLIVRVEGAAGIIAIDRPHRANAYTLQMIYGIDRAVAEHVSNETVRAIVFTGGRSGWFCAGADLKEMSARRAEDALDLPSIEVLNRIEGCPKPTIAAIDGPAVGGGLELALACDLRIATPKAKFALPETTLGLIPAGGGVWRLPRLVGRGLAFEMILLGRSLSAQEALDYSLVHAITESESLNERVIEWVQQISARDPLALRLAKKAIAMTSSDGGADVFSRAAQALLYDRRKTK